MIRCIPAAFEQNDLLVPDISISPEEVERTLLDVCMCIPVYPSHQEKIKFQGEINVS